MLKLYSLAFPYGAGSPDERERWQTMSDGEGASAAEAKCHEVTREVTKPYS
ncbi:MAG: hypothetical protein PUH93_06340 [Clostridia bacterium]|nr:hypothetical protein [Clostridia bacterium]